MAIRQIRKDGDEILRKKSKEVEEINDKILELIEDMTETMHEANGVGISAVQVGILKRVVVIDVYDGTGPIKLINPVIIKQKGKQEVEEGCLSFPNQFAKVVRPNEVTVKALNIKGKELLAQALAHEIDHLDGRLFVDIMEKGTLEYIEPEN